jgi:hypothetical protein
MASHTKHTRWSAHLLSLAPFQISTGFPAYDENDFERRSEKKVIASSTSDIDSTVPWTRWIVSHGHPVGVKTRLGVLLTGDDGNIYIACTGNKAYAIEVSLKEEHVATVISNIRREFRSQYSLGPGGIGSARRRPREQAESYNWKSPSALMDHLFSASKRSGSSDAYMRTNVGLERFDDLNLDYDAWNATSVPLEHIVSTSKTGETEYSKRKGFSADCLEYTPRKVKLRRRSTDRAANG